jgi:two-component system, LytTR family, response regulator
MSKVRTVVVDDERLAREGLEKLLRMDPDIEVVGSAADGRAAIQLIDALKPDLVFLDIQIPEIDGFGVISAIGVENMPVLVFVTAYDQYTLKAFDVHALDYLLKPFDQQRLAHAVKRAKQQVAIAHSQEGALQGLMKEAAANKPLKRLPIKAGGKFIFLELNEIDYIEAAGNYLCVHVGPKEYLTRETMASCEVKLQSSDFVRIHRSVIINRSRVKELKPWFTGEYVVVLSTGKELTLSRGYRDRLQLLLAER